MPGIAATEATPAIAPTRGLWVTLLPAHSGQAMTVGLMAPVIPAIASYFGGGSRGDFDAQLVAVTPFLGIMAGGMASGWGIKTAGLRLFALIAAVLYALGGIVGLVAPTLPTLLAGALTLGFGAIFLLTGLSALTAIAYEGTARARLVGLQAATGGLFNIALGLAGAFLAERWGWRVPFGFFLAFGAAMLLLAALNIPRAARDEGEVPPAIAPVARRIWPVLLAGAAAFFVVVSQATQLPFLMAEHGIASSGLRGVILTFIAGAAMLSAIAYSLFQQRVPERAIIAAVGVVGAAGWGLFGIWPGGIAMAFVAAALLGACLGVLVPILFGNAMRAVPGSASGLAVGLVNVALCFGSFVNPLLMSPLRAAIGLSGVMFVLAALTALTALTAVLWRLTTPIPADGAVIGAGPVPDAAR